VLYSESEEAYRLVFVTIFGIKVVMAYLPTPAPVSVVNKFQLLQAFFYPLKQALIHFSFKFSD
jgi:hypothetical protein